MKEYPTLWTKRLFLRPFLISDGRVVQRLAGDPEVSGMLFAFDPREPGVAEQWILDQYECFEKGQWVNFAVTDLSRGLLVGSVGLDIDVNPRDNAAEIMYWIGKEYWGKGYATEAARAVLAYGFDTIDLSYIYARYLVRNPASGCVLTKIGMSYKGCLPKSLRKGNTLEDLNMMGITKDEFEGR